MENKRNAVNIGVTLSSQLIAASLTMLTILGALLIFILDKREINFWFILLYGLGFITFIYSIICGGKGINIAREKGFQKKWSIKCSKKYFNRQAIASLLGIIFCISSILFTTKIPKEENTDLKNINSNLEEFIQLKLQEIEIQDSSDNKIERLEMKIDSIQKELNELKKKKKTTLPNKL